MKLEHAVHPNEIRNMLNRAGFSEEHIKEGFDHIKKAYHDVHQDLVAQNGFLPPLSKVFHKERLDADHSVRVQKGLFSGRLRRKDFILGFLFFFGIGYVTLVAGAFAFALLAPGVYAAILDHASGSEGYVLIMAVPFVLAPITVMMLSLITRRLHNLELPGILSLLFLAFFIPPTTGNMFDFGHWALYTALAVLFVVLLAKKGDPKPNRHGALPESRGSFFKRIFNT